VTVLVAVDVCVGRVIVRVISVETVWVAVTVCVTVPLNEGRVTVLVAVSD